MDDAGYRRHLIASATLAGLAFLPLAWAVTRRVGAGLSALGEQLAHWTAVLFAAMVLVAGIILGSLAAAVIFGAEVDPSAALIRFVPEIGYGAVLLAGALCVSLFLAIVSRAGQTTGAVPKWFWNARLCRRGRHARRSGLLPDGGTSHLGNRRRLRIEGFSRLTGPDHRLGQRPSAPVGDGRLSGRCAGVVGLASLSTW